MRTVIETRVICNVFCRIALPKRSAEGHQHLAFSRSMLASGSIALIFLLAGLVSGQTGKVVGVHDGDTLTVLTADKKELKIRMAGIDAPESKQDFGRKAKDNLSKLVFGKVVTVEGTKTDRYGRLVRKVLVDGVDANLAQIKTGLAWHYKEYEKEQTKTDRATYAAAETEARNTKIGLWSMPDPVPPAEYRHGPPVPDELRSKIIGNKKSRIYHRFGCQGFTKVTEKNRILFTTRKEAEAAGYQPAKNCPGTDSIRTND